MSQILAFPRRSTDANRRDLAESVANAALADVVEAANDVLFCAPTDLRAAEHSPAEAAAIRLEIRSAFLRVFAALTAAELAACPVRERV